MCVNEGKHYKQIDILRGMAVLMVLLYHSVIVYPVNLHEIAWCAGVHDFLWTLQMPVFFLVSGFCYSKKGSFKSYLTGRIKRILIPHVVFSMADILPRVIPNPFVHEKSVNFTEAFKDFVLYGGSDWFLRTLFTVALVFPAVEWIIKGSRLKKTAAIIVSLLLYLFYDKVPDVLCLNMTCGFFIYFLVGYLIKTEWKNPAEKLFSNNGLSLKYSARQVFLVLFFSFALISIGLYGFYRYTGFRVAEFLFAMSGATACTFLAGTLKGFMGDFLALCGKWSLQMYLLDPYALVFTRTLIVSLLGILNPVVIILGNFIPDTFMVMAASIYILGRYPLLRMISGVSEKRRNHAF